MRIDQFPYSTAEPSHTISYLLPTITSILGRLSSQGCPVRVFELGCGNGAIANKIAELGYDVMGVDPSPEGIQQGTRAFPNLRLELGSSESDLAGIYGQFPVVLSLEVVEHVFAPREFARRVFDLLEPGGTAIISTPYHGYLKNLALAVTGQMDQHFTVLWDNGHIKFWSVATLGSLLREAGFECIRFHRVGRVPPLAKSMIAEAVKPCGSKDV